MSPAVQQPRLRIGIDTGGTFTDIVSVDSGSGAMRVTKVASTPTNPAIGLVRGVRAILEAAGASPNEVAGLAHGTTVATNALLQGPISGLGLIVTAGFRHLLEIARQSVPVGYGNSYFWVKPERIVPLHFVCEVGGRLNFRGEEIRPLDEASVHAAAQFFRREGVRAVGICLIHSYANPAHERRVADIFARDYPDCTLSLSCAVLPEYREYERAVTTLVDAFVKPHMERYLNRVHDELGPGLQDKPFLVMQSSGGVASVDQVLCKPITTALSGPAAGALASAVVAEVAGFPDVVALDAGGTSTDLCLIEGGKPHVTNGGAVGAYPVRIPMIDIKTIGTGGGSIAWISREGHLKAGPAQSPAVMDLLGMTACIVPRDPGNLSAFGLLAVDWRTDRIVTKVMHEDAIDLATIASLYADLEKDAVDSLERDGIDLARIRVAREADVRYAGQSMEVRVAAPAGAIDAAFLAALIDAFHAAHLRTFGYNYAGEQKIELVNFCVSGFGLIERPDIPKLAARGASTPARKSVRPVYFDVAFRDTPVYDRAVLPAGFRLEGPAVVEEFGSTTVVFPAQQLDVDPHGILIVRSAQAKAEGVR